MSAIDDIVSANANYAARFDGPGPGRPQRHLAVVTCMDARIDPLAAFGLEVGNAHVIRNAGGIPTDDVLRSLALSQRALGTREVAIVHHTECGMNNFDDAAFRAELAAETGADPSWRVDGFTDLIADTRRSIDQVRQCPWLPHREDVRGFVFDVATGTITEVV